MPPALTGSDQLVGCRVPSKLNKRYVSGRNHTIPQAGTSSKMATGGAILEEIWLHAREKIRTQVFLESEEASMAVAEEIAGAIREADAAGVSRKGHGLHGPPSSISWAAPPTH